MDGCPLLFLLETVSRPHREEKRLRRLLKVRGTAWLRFFMLLSVRADTCDGAETRREASAGCDQGAAVDGGRDGGMISSSALWSFLCLIFKASLWQCSEGLNHKDICVCLCIKVAFRLSVRANSEACMSEKGLNRCRMCRFEYRRRDGDG